MIKDNVKPEDNQVKHGEECNNTCPPPPPVPICRPHGLRDSIVHEYGNPHKLVEGDLYQVQRCKLVKVDLSPERPHSYKLTLEDGSSTKRNVVSQYIPNDEFKTFASVRAFDAITNEEITDIKVKWSTGENTVSITIELNKPQKKTITCSWVDPNNEKHEVAISIDLYLPLLYAVGTVNADKNSLLNMCFDGKSLPSIKCQKYGNIEITDEVPFVCVDDLNCLYILVPNGSVDPERFCNRKSNYMFSAGMSKIDEVMSMDDMNIKYDILRSEELIRNYNDSVKYIK